MVQKKPVEALRGDDAANVSKIGTVPSSDLEWVIDGHQVLRVFLMGTAILVVCSTVGQVVLRYLPDFPGREGMADISYVDSEPSLPTLFSSLMFLACALVSGLITQARRREGLTHVRHWSVLSLLFLSMAIDEFASIHERAIAPLRELLDIESGPLYYAWILPGALLVVGVTVGFLGFLRQLPRSTRRRICTGGILLVSGAIGVELFGGWYAAVLGVDSMGYVLLTTVEETLEMLGATVLIYALVTHISDVLPNTGVRLCVQPELSSSQRIRS